MAEKWTLAALPEEGEAKIDRQGAEKVL